MQLTNYSLAHGVQNIKSRTAVVVTALTMAVTGGGVAAVTQFGVAHAAPSSSSATQSTTTAFTPSVVAGMTTDRTAPSGGYSSTSFGGRDNVLQMNVDGANRSTSGSFYYTEGLKQAVNGAVTAKADLYVNSDWIGTSVRAGLWGVGNDANGDISAYPIVEFTTAGDGGYTGWRVFNDEVGGWTNLASIPYNTNSWNTVGFSYNPATTTFDFTINGVAGGSSVATGSVDLSSLIFNNYNYGPTSTNYTVNWSNLVTGQTVTADKDSCKNNGYASLSLSDGTTFKNQGSCVSYFASNKH
ncbi:MAG: hypothetical protein ABIV43_01190 [Candidatus Saccharimonadales bacterium]